MQTETLAAAFEREHHEIDRGIEQFTAAQDAGEMTGPAVDALRQAMDALRRHIYLEEEVAFPPLRASGMFAAIMVMLREHGEIWSALDTIESELGADPAGPATRMACDTLLRLLSSHNAKEEPIIYPSLDTALPAEVGQRLRAFLASGRLPEGWVCARARA